MTTESPDPHATAIEAERSVLAAMLLAPEACALGVSLLKPQHFHRLHHRRMFEGLSGLSARGERADSITLTAELSRMGAVATDGWPVTISLVTDYAGSSANLAEHAGIVREAYAKRRIRKLGQKVEQASQDPGKGSVEILASVREYLEEVGAQAEPEGDGRFAEAAVDSSRFVTLEITRPASLLGNGVLTAGGLAILYGRPGLGKSWLLLSLAKALARGESWMNVETHVGGSRVGIIQLEVPDYYVQQRLRTLEIGTRQEDTGIGIVCRPMLKGVIDLYRNPADMAALRQWIIRDQLNMVAIDALSRAHTADENLAAEMSPILAQLDSIRHETGCAIILIHHETKKQENPDDHLSVLRGTGKLLSDPTLHIRVHESKGLRCVRFPRVTLGAEPDPIYYQIDRENGRPVIVGTPGNLAEENRGRVLSAVRDSGRAMASSEVAGMVGMSPATVKRHLQGLVDEGKIVTAGENRSTRYSFVTGSPAQPAQSDERAGGSVDISTRLNDSWG